MQFTRRSVQTAAAIAVLGSFMASPVWAQDKPKIALVMKSLANEFFRTMEDGAKAHQKANAAQYTLVANGIKDETDTAAQIKMVEQMVAQKINALVIAPADSKALVPVIKAAIDKGILVVNIDNRLDADALKEKGIQVPFVGPDNRAGAKLVGDALAKELKSGDKVGIIEGVSTTFNAQQRTLGYQDAMKAGGMTVVGVQSGQWEIDKGNTVAAVKAAGKTGKVLVVGYDNIGAIKPMLKDGRVLATADQFAARQAVFGIETALKAIADKKKQSEMPAEVKTDVILVTKSSK